MGYNGPAPDLPKPFASPAPPRGKGPLGQSGINPSSTVQRSYEREFLGRRDTSIFSPGSFLLGYLFGESD